jgi:hypothetical protein
MKDVFEKPFCNKSATSMLTFVPSPEYDATAIGISQTTDIDRATSVVPLQQVSRRSRSASPPWDIELDLNLPDESGTPPGKDSCSSSDRYQANGENLGGGPLQGMARNESDTKN